MKTNLEIAATTELAGLPRRPVALGFVSGLSAFLAAVSLLVAPVASAGGPEHWRDGGRGGFASGPGGAGGPGLGGHPMGGPGRILPLLLKQADLTAEQKRKVAKIIGAHKKNFEALFVEMRAAREAMSTKMFGPGTMTQADIDAAIARVAPIRERLMREGMGVALEVRALLTPEQIAKMADAKRRMETLREEMIDLYGSSDYGRH